MHGLGPGAHGLWPGADALPSRHPPSVLYIICYSYNSTDTRYYVAAATVAHALSVAGQGGTMPSSATKIAVASRWGDRCATFSGQHHITVTSRARIEVNATHGTPTVTTMPAPATGTLRDGTIPWADAPGGGGPSDEGPSPASSTRSETMTERRVTRSYYVNESGEILSSAGSATSEAD